MKDTTSDGLHDVMTITREDMGNAINKVKRNDTRSIPVKTEEKGMCIV
jgi:hypothetical protein